MVQSKEERKAKQKEYESTLEGKAKAKEYRSTPEAKAKKKKYEARPEVKAKMKEYRDRPEIKAKAKEYHSRPEIKTRFKEYRARPEVKAKAKEEYDKIRLKVLQHYSKVLSNSNVPCCNCCGLNEHTNFLALDHIAGKKQMDSESELVKLGYSSKFQVSTLHKFLIDNNFPDGFQILCHNCNLAKGFYGTCPHENKPH